MIVKRLLMLNYEKAVLILLMKGNVGPVSHSLY